MPYGLNIGLGALPAAFKYLSYRVAGSDELLAEVWKSTIGPAGNVFQDQGGCLTLNRVSAAPGMVTASGTAHRSFENRFRAVLRDAFGGVLASRSVSASGGWPVALQYTAPQGQGASFEAAASSAKDGALACLVQKVFALPASNLRANLHAVYRTYTDVNGDRRRDLVTVRRTGSSKGQVAVALAGGGRLSVTTTSDAMWMPGLVASGNVDGRPGEELFVDVAHVTTAERISIYTFWHGGLVKAGTLPACGDDHGVLYGVTCSVQGTRRFITDHSFYIKFGADQWMRQDTVYVWQGPALKLLTRGAAERPRGQPPPPLIGVQSGHLPSEAAASDRPAAARPASGPPIAPLAATNPPIQRTNYSHSRCGNGGSRLARARSCTRVMGYVHKEELSLREPS